MKRDNRNKSDEDQEQNVAVLETSNMKGDYGNVAILLFLYLLQGLKKDLKPKASFAYQAFLYSRNPTGNLQRCPDSPTKPRRLLC